MTFPKNIERWRFTVESVLSTLFIYNPKWKSLINRFKSTFSDQVDVILAIIQKESSGNEFAIGDNGNSIGLMQLNYSAGTPQDMGYKGMKEELFDPYQNIYYGSKYFLTQLTRYQDLEKAILSYNAGSYITKAGVPINLPYLKDVLAYLSEKKKLLLSDSLPSDSISSTEEQEKGAEFCVIDITPRCDNHHTVGSKIITGSVIGSLIGVIIYFLSC